MGGAAESPIEKSRRLESFLIRFKNILLKHKKTDVYTKKKKKKAAQGVERLYNEKFLT